MEIALINDKHSSEKRRLNLVSRHDRKIMHDRQVDKQANIDYVYLVGYS